jgi:hypothetical protein
MTDTAASPAAPKAAVAALRSFVAAHGGSADAVVAHLGRRGARVSLVGADGVWGDQVLADVATATAACAAAGVPVADSWGRELSEAVRTSGYEWGLMGRGRPHPRPRYPRPRAPYKTLHKTQLKEP